MWYHPKNNKPEQFLLIKIEINNNNNNNNNNKHFYSTLSKSSKALHNKSFKILSSKINNKTKLDEFSYCS